MIDDDALRLEVQELRHRLREAEETLAANRLRQDVLSQMQDAVLAFDAQDRLVFLNAAAQRQYGVTAASGLGRAQRALFTQAWPDGEAARASAQEVLRRDGVYRGRLAHVTADGRSIPVEITVSLLRLTGDVDRSGQLYVIRDISDRIAAEQSLAAATAELARRERQFSTLVENSPDIISRLDRKLRHLYVSPVVEQVTGRKAAEFLGKTNRELGMPADLCRAWDEALGRVFATGAMGRITFRFPAVTGDERVFEARLVPEFDDGGAVESVLSVAVDVTDQEAAGAALRAADRKKDEFLATLAHELRNPLAPIRNALQIMRMAHGAQLHEDARSIIERQLGQMVHLVDDLLDVSRISQGKLELRLEATDVGAVVRAAVETSRPWVDAGAHTLEVAVPGPGALMVHADFTRLCQVVANLLNNAAKYTPDGGRIEVSAGREGREAVVSVQDCGIGIAPAMLPRVFEMFAQVHRHSDRAQGGLGIGLALVKQLVEMHGGSVEAHSEGAGMGCRFVVRLPLAQAGTAPGPGGDDGPLQVESNDGVRVLVVDDNVDSAETMAQMLELMGYATHTAHDGLAAVAAAATFRPHAAVLDIGLPHISGHEAARRIRALEGGSDILLVALSGWGQDEDHRLSAEAGFDRHFVKPVELHTLLEVLARERGRPRRC